jgi:hypothetical protein
LRADRESMSIITAAGGPAQESNQALAGAHLSCEIRSLSRA